MDPGAARARSAWSARPSARSSVGWAAVSRWMPGSGSGWRWTGRCGSSWRGTPGRSRPTRAIWRSRSWSCGWAEAAGFQRTFELPSRPANPTHATDVGLRDDRGRRLILVECWNTIGDLGAAVRSTNRKRVEAEDLAAVRRRRRDPCQAGQTQASPTPWPPSGSSAPPAGTATSWRATRSSSPADSPARAEPGCRRSPPALGHRRTWVWSGAMCAPPACTPGGVAT